jgi:hypothetical protein
MKIRQGYVSNSSSSSFVIQKKNLSEFQLNAIRNHIEVYNIYKNNYEHLDRELSRFGDDYDSFKDDVSCFSDCATDDDAWTISEDEDTVKGSTWMDNFDIEHLFKLIGLDSSDYKFN